MDHHSSGHGSPHIRRLMGGHSSHHNTPSDKLIRHHHAEGGQTYAQGEEIGRPTMATGGGLPSPQFRKGGSSHRHHRDAGGSLEESERGNKPLNPMKGGGKAHHRYHRSIGGFLGNVAKGVGALGQGLMGNPTGGYSKGGRCHKRKMAMGGIGKFRKGVM